MGGQRLYVPAALCACGATLLRDVRARGVVVCNLFLLVESCANSSGVAEGSENGGRDELTSERWRAHVRARSSAGWLPPTLDCHVRID